MNFLECWGSKQQKGPRSTEPVVSRSLKLFVRCGLAFVLTFSLVVFVPPLAGVWSGIGTAMAAAPEEAQGPGTRGGDEGGVSQANPPRGVVTGLAVGAGRDVDPGNTAPPPDITVDGSAWTPEGAFVTGQVLMAPFEETCKALGARGFFDEFTQVMRVHRPGTMLQMAVKSMSMTVNGEPRDLPMPPVKKDGLVFVPVRALAEGLGCQVTWDDAAKRVAIKLPEGAGPAEVSRGDGIDRQKDEWVVSCSEEEFDLLACVINAEAGDEPFEGQVAVGAVIVNRVRSPFFPDTVAEVVFQPGQFKVIENGRYKEALTGKGREAAVAALRGEDPSRGALFFFNPRIAKAESLFKRPVTAEIGSHRFTQ